MFFTAFVCSCKSSIRNGATGSYCLLFLVYFFFCQIGADGTAKQCLILKQSQTDASFASFTRFSVLGLFHASAEKVKHHIWKHLLAVKILPACSSKMNMCLAVSHTWISHFFSNLIFSMRLPFNPLTNALLLQFMLLVKPPVMLFITRTTLVSPFAVAYILLS